MRMRVKLFVETAAPSITSAYELARVCEEAVRTYLQYRTQGDCRAAQDMRRKISLLIPPGVYRVVDSPDGRTCDQVVYGVQCRFEKNPKDPFRVVLFRSNDYVAWQYRSLVGDGGFIEPVLNRYYSGPNAWRIGELFER